VAIFIGHLNDGTADSAFNEDLELTRRYGVRGFPTFLFRVGKRELKLGGYQDFKAIQTVIHTLGGGSIQGRPPAKSSEDVLAFLRKYGRAAPVEVTTVFELTPKEMEETVALLLEKGRIRRVVAGNGYFLEPVAVGQVCDVKTGMCIF